MTIRDNYVDTVAETMTNDTQKLKIINSITMPAKIYHFGLYGKREDKYEFLRKNSISTTPWTELKPDPKYHFFVPKDFSLQEEYEQGIKVSELFEVYKCGIKTHHDSELVSHKNFNSEFNTKYNYRNLDNHYINYDRKLVERDRFDLMKHILNHKNISFITTRQLSSEKFTHIGISKIITDICFLSNKGKESCYNFPLYLYPDAEKGEGGGVFGGETTPKAIENDVFGETTPSPSVTPLKQGNLRKGLNPRPNFKPEVVAQIEEKLGMKLDWEAGIDQESYSSRIYPSKQTGSINASPTKFTPTDLLDYIYAVLHSPTYREKYKEFLKIDFPRIPFGEDWLKTVKTPRQPAVTTPQEWDIEFWRLVAIGSKLRKLHLMEDIGMENLTVGYNVVGSNAVESVRWERETTPSTIVDTPQEGNSTKLGLDNLREKSLGKVWINETQHFENVSDVAWSFYIGGYQPAQKWLKDRKNRELTFDDIMHYQKILYILESTDTLMNQIDNV